MRPRSSHPRTLTQLSRRLLRGYLIALCVLFVVLQFGLLYPNKLTYVARLQQLALAGLQQDLQQLAETQLAINRDYAYWDDSYNFVQQPTEAYIRSNLDPAADTLGLLQLNGLLITDIDLSPLLAQAKHPQTLEYLPFTQLFPRSRPLIDPRQIVANGRSGWLYNDEGLFLLSVAMIRPTLQQGPPAGYMFFLRHFSAHQLRQMGKLQGLRLELGNQTDAPARPLATLSTPPFAAARQHAFYLPGLDGSPALELTAVQEGHPLPPLLSLKDLFLLLGVTLLPFLGMLRYQEKLIDPIVRTIAQIGRLDADGLPLTMRPEQGVKDLDTLAESYNLLVRSVREDQERLRTLADTDGLTGLLNRRAFDRALTQALPRAQRLGQPLCLTLLDVDYFKRYNDHYGHPAGDAVLRRLGQLLHQHFGRATDCSARYGGEEFVLLLEAQPLPAIQAKLEQLRQALLHLAIEHCGSDCAPVVSASLGAIYWQPRPQQEPAQSAEQLLAQADLNLYRAKQAGRNRLVISQSPPRAPHL